MQPSRSPDPGAPGNRTPPILDYGEAPKQSRAVARVLFWIRLTVGLVISFGSITLIVGICFRMHDEGRDAAAVVLLGTFVCIAAFIWTHRRW